MTQVPVRLYVAERIYTMDPIQPVVESLVVAGERILARGQTREMSAIFPMAKRLDLAGQTVLPGLTDSHIHMLSYGLSRQRLDLRQTRSLGEAIILVGKAVAAAAPGAWVLGRGWDVEQWTEGRWPTRQDLDPISADHPVALTSKDGHTLWVNSLALRKAGMDVGTYRQKGGDTAWKESGSSQGLLKEKARAPVLQVINPPNDTAMRQALEEVTRLAHQLGIVAIHDMEGADAFRLFQMMREQHELRLRVWITVPVDSTEHAVELGLRGRLGDSWLRLGGVKIFADGTLGSKTAAMLEPFMGEPDNRGILTYSSQELTEVIGQVVGAGLWPVIHAIGDRANREVLDSIAAHCEVARRSYLRFRIEHAQIIHPADVHRLGHLGIIASMQPIHATSDRDIVEQYLGTGNHMVYPWRSLLKSGATLAFGSDAPIETMDPWQGLFAAVTRRRPDRAEDSWYPDEVLSVEEALRAYTAGAAFAAGEESIRGMLRPGYLADFIVCSGDILSEGPEVLLENRVLATVIGGKVAYSVGALAGLGAAESSV